MVFLPVFQKLTKIILKLSDINKRREKVIMMSDHPVAKMTNCTNCV